MPIPLIPIIIGAGSALLGALGIKKGLDANENFDKAKSKGERAQTNYNQQKKEFTEAEWIVKKKANDLTVFKRKIYSNTVSDFIEVFEKFKKVKLTELNMTVLNFEFTETEILNFKQQAVNFEESAKGLLSASATGAAAGFGSLGLIGAVGTASTGTAISTLAGAAASNATLAWLGGGALSVGGLGVAGGTMVLGGIVVGPALAVGGFFLAGKSEQALSDAINYENETKQAIEKMNRGKSVLSAINLRIHEIIDITTKVNAKLSENIKYLKDIDTKLGEKKEYETKDLEESDLKTLFITFSLAKSLKSILEVPILNNDGKVSDKSKETCSEIQSTMEKLNA
ncbi:MAG: hypothetical protein KA146_05705 [Leptospiraceae bacterium]|nr:hypothetical protein [Leptospiraceae bacterium]